MQCFLTGGSGLSSLDGVLVAETMAYGCTGITTALLSNDLAVSWCLIDLHIFLLLHFCQECPILVGGNEEQKKKYLGRMTEEPLHCVSITLVFNN